MSFVRIFKLIFPALLTLVRYKLRASILHREVLAKCLWENCYLQKQLYLDSGKSGQENKKHVLNTRNLYSCLPGRFVLQDIDSGQQQIACSAFVGLLRHRIVYCVLPKTAFDFEPQCTSS